MNAQNIILKSEKKVYSTPILEIIKLDNEITLILDSAPAVQFDDPNCQNNLNTPDYFNNSPFA